MANNKVQFGSKIGMIAATVGSAVGLGNVWRFPAETQANGGAAFLLVYVGCVFLLGIPVMLAEFSLGRGVRSDTIGVFRALAPKTRWWLTGAFASLAPFLILAFYMVVAGWTAEYLWQSITGELFAPVTAGVDLDTQFASRMQQYIASDVRPLVMTAVVLLINLFILAKGVQKGIEKMSNIMMPLLVVLLIVFAAVSVSLPGASEGLAYFFRPDFSQINAAVVLNAMGQAFFSLSLGMGILVVYAGYFAQDTRLAPTAVTVSMLDMMVAIMMGIVIFPAVTSFGLTDHDLKGAALVFVTLPEVFAQMPAPRLWSALFFLLLLVAAITSTVSLAEVNVSLFQNRLGMSRRRACLLLIAILLPLSALCSLSMGSLGWIKILGMNIFDLLDNVATNIMLPVVSILICIYMGWFAPKGYFRREYTNNGTACRRSFPIVLWLVRLVCPVLIAIILISYFLGK